MKTFLYISLFFLLSCSQQPKETPTSESPSELNSNNISDQPPKRDQKEIQYKAELVKYGENPESPYPSRIDSLTLKISTKDEIVLIRKITKYDFNSIFEKGFINDGEIYRAEILKLDTAKSKVLVLMMYGFPNSDSHLYEVVHIIDFTGGEYLIPASYSCYPRLRLKYDLIGTCEGVHTYEQQIFKVKECCTVFSCLINKNTFFYVHDDQYNTEGNSQNNAYFINLTTKDTIKSFNYDQFTYTISYSSLMWYSDEFDKLTYLNLEDSTLTVINQDLTELTYQFNDLPIKSSINRDLKNRIYSYSIESMDQPIFVQFDTDGKPIAMRR